MLGDALHTCSPVSLHIYLVSSSFTIGTRLFFSTHIVLFKQLTGIDSPLE